jgi:hypothetical protein
MASDYLSVPIGFNDSGLKFVWPSGIESIAGQTHRIWVPYLYILSLFRLCVWPPFVSAPRHDRDSRAVSLEPVWPEECPSINNSF